MSGGLAGFAIGLFMLLGGRGEELPAKDAKGARKFRAGRVLIVGGWVAELKAAMRSCHRFNLSNHLARFDTISLRHVVVTADAKGHSNTSLGPWSEIE
jgi:hypothetical protein